MEYSKEFKELVYSGYYRKTTDSTILCGPYASNILSLLESGEDNKMLGELLYDGCRDWSISAIDILTCIDEDKIDILREEAEMVIKRREAYIEWRKNYRYANVNKLQMTPKSNSENNR